MTITDLAPDYETVYRAGGLSLTVLINDTQTASSLFDRGVRALPFSFKILYAAAYHALVEEKNPDKAASLMRRAADAGGPSWLYALAGRLYTEAGKKELAVTLLEDLRSQDGMDTQILKRLEEHIQRTK